MTIIILMRILSRKGSKQGKWFKHPSDIIWKYDDHHNFIWWSWYDHNLIKQNIPNKWKQGFDANLLSPVHICTPLMKLNLNFTQLYAVKPYSFSLLFLEPFSQSNKGDQCRCHVTLGLLQLPQQQECCPNLKQKQHEIDFKRLSSFFWFVTMCVCLLCRKGGREIACTDPIVRMMKLESTLE